MGPPSAGSDPDAAGRHLEAAARALVRAADEGRPLGPLLKRLCPYVYGQLARDARRPALFSFWGRCVNVDENVGEQIAHPAILEAIGTLAGVPMCGRSLHAGLQHTYGYLFSLIETPYGFKRDRWVSTDLERGFGVDATLFGERPRQGTLLANVTWFLGRIVFRDRPSSLRRLLGLADAAAPELVRYDYARLSVRRVVEAAPLPGEPDREVFLRTDLVRYPHPPADRDAESVLLVYSSQRGARARVRLVTAFPVRAAVADELIASARVPAKADVRLRYNAYVAGLFGRTVRGRRYRADGPG